MLPFFPPFYCSRPEIRRLLALRDSAGLRVLVQLEPAQDSGEIHPVWIANRREWRDELQFHMCSVVRLERAELISCRRSAADQRDRRGSRLAGPFLQLITLNGVAMSKIRILGAALALALGAQATLPAQAAEHAIVTSLLQKDVPEAPGKELLMISVEYPPGSVDPIHRHDAHAFVYVLEGTIVMQVKGGKEVTLTPGQTFYEGPNDIHTVGRNASTTKPAKFIVVLLKKKGADVLTPVQ